MMGQLAEARAVERVLRERGDVAGADEIASVLRDLTYGLADRVMVAMVVAHQVSNHNLERSDLSDDALLGSD